MVYDIKEYDFNKNIKEIISNNIRKYRMVYVRKNKP